MTNAAAALPPLGADELRRHARHIRLAQVGLAGQQRLEAARVLLVGAGGRRAASVRADDGIAAAGAPAECPGRLASHKPAPELHGAATGLRDHATAKRRR